MIRGCGRSGSAFNDRSSKLSHLSICPLVLAVSGGGAPTLSGATMAHRAALANCPT